VFAVATAFALAARPVAPDADALAAAAAQSWIHPKEATDVYYHFEVETEGLPKHMWKPPPRDIDVTYRDLDTGRLVTERGVDADWIRIFRNPKFSRGRIEAVAEGGGYMWCIFEVAYADSSGWTVSEFGRHRCRAKRSF
jgi:hypothetical protein